MRPAILLLCLGVCHGVRAEEKKPSVKEIRQGGIYSNLQSSILKEIAILKQFEARLSIRPPDPRVDAHQKRLKELMDLKVSLVRLQDEQEWVRAHAAPRTPFQQEIAREVEGRLPQAKDALNFAEPGSALGQLGRPGVWGQAFDTASRKDRGLVVVNAAQERRLLVPDGVRSAAGQGGPAAEEALRVFNKDMGQVLTSLHEAFHISHPLIDSPSRRVPGRMRVRATEDEKWALASLLEEGYTHLQTRRAVRELLADPDSDLARRLNERWASLLQELGPLPSESDLSKIVDDAMSSHYYQPRAEIVAKILETYGSRARKAFDDSGSVLGTIQLLDGQRRSRLARFALLYLDADHDEDAVSVGLIRREMDRVISDPAYGKDRAEAFLRVRHILDLFRSEFRRRNYHPLNPSYLLNPEGLERWDSWVSIWQKTPGLVTGDIFEFVDSFYNPGTRAPGT